jgi:NAD(P)-dependent dehydrogenase (short-subunit alcohol dehydrogenase family)
MEAARGAAGAGTATLLVICGARGIASQGLPNMAHDSAAKAYVLNLGEALHYELAPAGVDVTVLLPGSVDTPIIDALGLRGAALPIRPQPADAVHDPVHATVPAATWPSDRRPPPGNHAAFRARRHLVRRDARHVRPLATRKATGRSANKVLCPNGRWWHVPGNL